MITTEELREMAESDHPLHGDLARVCKAMLEERAARAADLLTSDHAELRRLADVSEADAIISDLEAKGLNWSIRHGNGDIATSVWNSGTVICGDYYSNKLEPLAWMLRGAIADMEKNEVNK